MRLVHALPLLSFSACVMFVGLWSHATAQPPVAPPPPSGAPAAPSATEHSEPAPFRDGLEGTDTRPTPPRARVSFNLEDADLPDLVRVVARMTGKRFILPTKAQTIRASVVSPTDVSAAEAYEAFLSILSLNGLSVRPSGAYYEIVPTEGAEGRRFPMGDDGDPVPASDRFVTRLQPLEHVDAADAAALLEHFRSPEGAVTAYAPTNSLFLTDTANNVRRMLAILAEVDVPRTGDQLWIEPIHYAVASDLVEILSEMFPTDEGDGASPSSSGPPHGGKAPVTREGGAAQAGAGAHSPVHVGNLLADERTNVVIIQATERAYLRVMEAIRALDVPVDGDGSVHVYELQYADADNVAEVLSSLVEGGGGGGEHGGAHPPEAGAGITRGEVGIQAFADTNSLLVTASQSDYASLRRVLEELDVAPRQVFIEAVIMELTVQHQGRMGLSYHGGIEGPDTSEGSGFSVLGFGAASSLGIGTSAMLTGDTLTGAAIGVRGPTITTNGLSIPSFGVMLTALATTSDVDVLSTPHLLAMDNVEAEITVGLNIPLQQNGLGSLGSLAGLASSLTGQTATSQSSSALGSLAGLASGSSALGASGGRQNVGTTLRVTPHVNDEGEIRLEIEEEISEAQPAQGSLGVVPIAQRMAKTQVLVRDQETVVIGGLMRDRVATSEEKIPILGDIPILGALFRRETRTTEKTNLLMFLTPYIIRSPEDLRSIFERRMRERQEFLERNFVFGDHDYEPVLDFSRTRGLVQEIFGELDRIDEERAIAEELAEEPPPDHRARAPLGEAEPFEPPEGMLVIRPDDPAELDLPQR
ncbi:MAG: type II secretion system secretin GspD [Sandaracinus sp.]